MNEWVDLMRSGLKDEFGTKPWIGALATVDQSLRPRVRSIVCRKVEDDGNVWVTCDSRSAKIRDIATHPFGEVVFWLPERREQFRVAGRLEHFAPDDPRTSMAWQNLSDATRATFFWPDSRGETIPQTFALLVLSPDRAEHLDLNPVPHYRRCWEAASGWTAERIDP